MHKPMSECHEFLSGLIEFADFTDEQFEFVEKKITVEVFECDTVVCNELASIKFFIVKEGCMEVLIHGDKVDSKVEDSTPTCFKLTPGCCFSANNYPINIRSLEHTVCFVILNSDIESCCNCNQLQLPLSPLLFTLKSGNYSLMRHIESIHSTQSQTKLPIQTRKMQYELATTLTPELGTEELIHRMALILKKAIGADRVGLFIRNGNQNSMVLKVPDKAKGIKLDLSGIAGTVITTGQSVCVDDAYTDSRFNPRMDKKTGYHTKQVLCVPLLHLTTRRRIGALQINNIKNNDYTSFSEDHCQMLQITAAELSELLIHRLDSIVNTDDIESECKSNSNSRSSSRKSSQPQYTSVTQSQSQPSTTALISNTSHSEGSTSMRVISSAQIAAPLELMFTYLQLGKEECKVVVSEGLTHLELQVSVHMGIQRLCPPQTVLAPISFPYSIPLRAWDGERGHARDKDKDKDQESTLSFDDNASVGSVASEKYSRVRSSSCDSYQSKISAFGGKFFSGTNGDELPASSSARLTKPLFSTAGTETTVSSSSNLRSSAGTNVTVEDTPGPAQNARSRINRGGRDQRSLSCSLDYHTSTVLINTRDVYKPLHASYDDIQVDEMITPRKPAQRRSIKKVHQTRKATDTISPNSNVTINQRIRLEIPLNSLHCAARLLIKVSGRCFHGTEAQRNATLLLAWTVAPLFDHHLYLKPSLELKLCSANSSKCVNSSEFPVSAALTNFLDDSCATLSCMVAQDILSPDDFYQIEATETVDSLNSPQYSRHHKANVKVVHRLPNRDIAQDISLSESLKQLVNSDTYKHRINRIWKDSINPIAYSDNLLASADKMILWTWRYSLLDKPHLLPALVMSMNWAKLDQLRELYTLLDLWSPISATQALQLLDRRVSDPVIRAFAVKSLESLSDSELALYLPQLCQQLKFEPFLDSALSRLLLRRATMSRNIGHRLFWVLKCEDNFHSFNINGSSVFRELLQIYLLNCGSFRMELGRQMFVSRRLERVAEAVCKGVSKEDRQIILVDELARLTLPSCFSLPLLPDHQFDSINIDSCRVMESKKKPLWLTFNSAKSSLTCDPLIVMLKLGDDLRQDSLITQLLQVVANLWKRAGGHCALSASHMRLYECLSTGQSRGLLEVIPSASTLAQILLQASDSSKSNVVSSFSKYSDKDDKDSLTPNAYPTNQQPRSRLTSAFESFNKLVRKCVSANKALSDKRVLKEWLKRRVQEDGVAPKLAGLPFDAALEYKKRAEVNFVYSTAAFCICSYVLGLGDRHNDNLMLTTQGDFFHIDFGHIFGNFKSKMGMRRERAPFVFTYAMKSLMGAEGYSLFVRLCGQLYNELRANAGLLLTLTSLAVPCGLPELQEESDASWLFDRLMIGASNEEASKVFTGLIEVSLSTRTTRFNDAFHMLKHA